MDESRATSEVAKCIISMQSLCIRVEVENSLNQLFQYLVMPHLFKLLDTNLIFVNLSQFSIHTRTKLVCRHLQVSDFKNLRFREK